MMCWSVKFLPYISSVTATNQVDEIVFVQLCGNSPKVMKVFG